MLFWPYYIDGLARWWRPAARQESDDQHLARMVAERLRSDPWTCLEPVHVKVQNRVVILEGHVDSETARWAAVYQAWQTPGVFDVCDALTDRGNRAA